MALGYVLAESMRPGSRLEGLPLTLTKIERYTVHNAAPEQPSVWTAVEFQFPGEEAGRLADALAEVLEEKGGWYSHFNVNGETFVVYAVACSATRAATTLDVPKPRTTAARSACPSRSSTGTSTSSAL
jgi:hypothetical protein